MTKFSMMICSIFLLICLTGLSCSDADPGSPDLQVREQLQHLTGTYTSIATENWGNGTFGHRTFT